MFAKIYRWPCFSGQRGKSGVIPRYFHVRLFALWFFCAVPVAGISSAWCASPTGPDILLKRADSCRKALYASAAKKKYRHHWLKCISRYKTIYSRYPASEAAVWALYHSARLYTGLYVHSGRQSDLDESLRFFRLLVKKYPRHRLADDAQYLIGRIYDRYRKNPAQAYVEFLKVEVKFPSGDMVSRARKRLQALALTIRKNEERNHRKPRPRSKPKPVAVKDIRHWSTPNYTRVVIDLESPVTYTYHLLRPDPDIKKPRRLYLDLKNAHVTRQIESPVVIKDGLLRLARAGQYSKNTVRVVLDMESIGGYDVFRLHDPFRIVVDVRRHKKRAFKGSPQVTGKKRHAGRGIKRTNAPDRKVSLARQLGLNVRRIVIDPGHGGKDPGCHGRGGIKEKDIVLSLAKILARKIRKELGCEVFLTRTRDVFLPLEKRTAIANIKKADLFISIHVNAHKCHKISGIETYFLNMATDERSVMVAARENATSEKNISDLQTILNDLMLNTKIHESSRLAYDVQNAIVSQVGRRYKRPRNLGVKQAPFYVLIGADMPAILVETGFLTNPVDRKRLRSGTYRDCIAEGICKGIKQYMASIDQVYQGG